MLGNDTFCETQVINYAEYKFWGLNIGKNGQKKV